MQNASCLHQQCEHESERGLLCHRLCGPASRASSPYTHKQQADVGGLIVYQALNSLNNGSNDAELWQSNRESALFPHG